MNKITKANFKKLVLALALTLVMTLGMSISVFAATGAINGYTTRASSTIRQQQATAYIFRKKTRNFILFLILFLLLSSLLFLFYF